MAKLVVAVLDEDSERKTLSLLRQKGYVKSIDGVWRRESKDSAMALDKA